MIQNDYPNFDFIDHLHCLREFLAATREAIIMGHLANLGETYDSPDEIEYAVTDFSSQLEKLSTGAKAISWIEDIIGPILEEHSISNVPYASLKRESGDLRVVRIQITQGMINQSLLSLTKPKKEGLINESETFHITLPWGQEFEAAIKQPGNRLSERGLIAQFYKKANIKEGDCVQLDEYEFGRWRISKTNRSPRDFLMEDLLLGKEKE